MEDDDFHMEEDDMEEDDNDEEEEEEDDDASRPQARRLPGPRSHLSGRGKKDGKQAKKRPNYHLNLMEKFKIVQLAEKHPAGAGRGNSNGMSYDRFIKKFLLGGSFPTVTAEEQRKALEQELASVNQDALSLLAEVASGMSGRRACGLLKEGEEVENRRLPTLPLRRRTPLMR